MNENTGNTAWHEMFADSNSFSTVVAFFQDSQKKQFLNVNFTSVCWRSLEQIHTAALPYFIITEN